MELLSHLLALRATDWVLRTAVLEVGFRAQGSMHHRLPHPRPDGQGHRPRSPLGPLRPIRPRPTFFLLRAPSPPSASGDLRGRRTAQPGAPVRQSARLPTGPAWALGPAPPLAQHPTFFTGWGGAPRAYFLCLGCCRVMVLRATGVWPFLPSSPATTPPSPLPNLSSLPQQEPRP